MRTRRPKSILIVAALALMITCVMLGSGASKTHQAKAATTVKVCLLNYSSECANVYNNAKTANSRINIWQNGGSDLWEIVPTSCVAGSACFYIKDAQNTALCMTATGTNGAVLELKNCAEAGSWYNEGDNIVGNGYYGQAGNMITNGNVSGDFLYAKQTGPWIRWSIPGLN